MRVVIDTNVLISRLLSPTGPPARVFALWEQQRFDLLVTEAILAEYGRALRYDKIRRYHGWADTAIEHFIQNLAELAILVTPTVTLAVVRDDPADNRFLECAQDGNAQYIVSGDRHLLALGDHRGIPILKPQAFLTALSQGL